MARSNTELVDLVREKADSYLDHERRSEAVLQAMLRVDRADFLPWEMKALAYQDEALPLGYGESCSQPSMVAFMLDRLGICPGHRVLEVGAGCGYAAAVASRLCAREGIVFACEIVPELVDQMRLHLESRFSNIQIVLGDGSLGFPDLAPFDRIFLSAGVDLERFQRQVLVAQLTDFGRLLFPEAEGNLHLVERRGADETLETLFYGVRFVPLVGRNS